MTPLMTFGKTLQSQPILNALVLAYVALLPFQFNIGSHVNFAPADCMLFVALVLALGLLRYRTPAWSAWHFGIVATLVMGTFIAALRFGGLSQYELLNKDAGLLSAFLGYVVITSSVSGWDDLRRIMRVFTLSVALQNLVAVGGFLAAYFFGVTIPFARYGGLRLSGMLIDPNAYGGLLIAAFVMCEGACVGPAPLFKGPTLWLCRLTLGMGLLFTFSRSAWTGLGLALLLLCVIQMRTAVRLILAGVIAAPCLLLLMGNRFIPIFEEMASRPKQVQGRFDLIHAALHAFTGHPFLGGGIGSFRLEEGEIAHNSAMWFLADFGIVGLVVLLGFLGWFFAKCWTAYRLAPAAESSHLFWLLLWPHCNVRAGDGY